MRIIRAIDAFPIDLRSGAVVIGNFDGVHKGHAALIARAEVLGGPVIVLTFSPHPRCFFRPHDEPFLLTPGDSKLDHLSALDVAACVELPFTPALAHTPAEDFVLNILARGLGARHVVVGHDFRFGADRRGDAGSLQALGAEFGFAVSVVPPICDEAGRAYSSSRIRSVLRAGDMISATVLLGRSWTIASEILPGHQVALGAHVRPASGFYAASISSVGLAHDPAVLFFSAGVEAKSARLYPLGAVKTPEGRVSIALDARIAVPANLDEPTLTAAINAAVGVPCGSAASRGSTKKFLYSKYD